MEMVSTLLLSEAIDFIMTHKRAIQQWQHGEPKNTWIDDDGFFCIEYDDGEWWHYGYKDGDIIWWK